MKKIGLMGCGMVAGYGHLPALRARPDLELTSIFDPDPARLAAAKEKFGVPNAFTEPEPFFESGIDAVSITSPAPCHVANAEMAARYGKHVLCEKPLAMTEEEAASMIATMEKAGLMLFTGFTYRFAPVALTIMELLRLGAIGIPRSLRFVYIWNCHGRYETDETGNRIEQRRRQGRMLEGGPMVDCGTHQIDLSRWWLASEVVAATGMGAWVQDYEAPDHVYLHMDHANGAHTMVEISYSYCHTAAEPVYVYTYDIVGTEGVIRYGLPDSVLEVRSSAGTTRHDVGREKNFEGMYAAFAHALETGDPGNLATGSDGLIATRIARTATEEAMARRRH